MDALQLDRLLELVNWSSLVFWAIWVRVIWLTIAIPLTVMMYTRWGQSKPLGKCLILSAVAHLLVAIALFTRSRGAFGSDFPGTGDPRCHCRKPGSKSRLKLLLLPMRPAAGFPIRRIVRGIPVLFGTGRGRHSGRIPI